MSASTLMVFSLQMIGLYKRRNDNSVDTALNFTMTDVETSHDVETTLRKQLEVLNERLQKYEVSLYTVRSLSYLYHTKNPST